MLVRASWIAGTSPVANPETSAATAATPNTRKSRLTSCCRGRLPGGRSANNQPIPQTASTKPTSAPENASSTLSVNSCRTTRARPAPSALRTAISRSRPDARASSVLATFAHAMSSTNVTIVRSATSVPRIPDTTLSRSGRTVMPSPVFDSGYERSSCDASPVISA